MMLSLKTIILLCVLVLVANACTPVPPWQRWMLKGPPPREGITYPPKYVEGWQHGCETGISATANQWYKMTHKFRQDPILAQDRTYYRGWKDAFDYCQRYQYQWRNRTAL